MAAGLHRVLWVFLEVHITEGEQALFLLGGKISKTGQPPASYSASRQSAASRKGTHL